MASVFQNMTYQGGVRGALDPFGIFGSGKKKGSSMDDLPIIDVPDFFQDEYYPKTQADLYGLSSGLLKGEVPDYYKPLGEIGGPELEDLLSMLTRDVTDATEESAIRRNAGRGGSVDSAIAKNVGDISTKVRWEDFARALTGREMLLKLGIGTEEGVRTAGLNNQSQKNAFNLDAYDRKIDERNTRYGISQGIADRESAMTGDILSSLISAGGTMAGMYFGGPAGAVAGQKLGSAAGNSFSGGSYGLSSKASDIDKWIQGYRGV